MYLVLHNIEHNGHIDQPGAVVPEDHFDETDLAIVLASGAVEKAPAKGQKAEPEAPVEAPTTSGLPDHSAATTAKRGSRRKAKQPL